MGQATDFIRLRFIASAVYFGTCGHGFRFPSKDINYTCINMQKKISFLVAYDLKSQHFCSGQKMLEDFQGHLDKEANRRDDLSDKLNRQSHILFDVKSGVSHLADKLSHLKAVSKERDSFSS